MCTLVSTYESACLFSTCEDFQTYNAAMRGDLTERYKRVYEYFKKALETSEGSGKALQAMGLWAIAIALIIAAVILKT